MTNLCVYISLEATVLCLKRRTLSVKFGYPDSVPKDLTMSNAISVSVVGIPLVNFVIGHGAFGLRKGMVKSSCVGATIRAQAQSVLVASRLAGCLFTGAKHGDVLLARVDKPIPEQAHSGTSPFRNKYIQLWYSSKTIDHLHHRPLISIQSLRRSARYPTSYLSCDSFKQICKRPAVCLCS
jgi:hypothetical protein